MLKSMTAYGQAIVINKLGKFVAEIQSVNRKHLEMQLYIPREFQRFDHDIRKLIAANVSRGHITFRLAVRFEETSPTVVSANIPFAKQVKQACNNIAKEIGVNSEQLALEILARQDEVLVCTDEMSDENFYRQIILEAAETAIKHYNEMRAREGATLQKEIEFYLKRLQENIALVAQFAPNAIKKLQDKLKERIEEVLPGNVENEERLLREICLYAEKADIAEELVRFKSHLDQCNKVIHSAKGSTAKTLEFLLQELVRETNTIGSKSSEIEVTRIVVEIKGDLERIREQIQNVE